MGALCLFFDIKLQIEQMKTVKLQAFQETSFSIDVVHNWLSKSERKKSHSAGIWYLINISAEQNKLALDGSKLHLDCFSKVLYCEY